MTETQTIIQRQDPFIEAYRLGLLQDVQGFTQNQIFGQNVQNLRAQALSPQQIAQRLSTPEQGTKGEPGYRAAVTYTPDQVSSISSDAMFRPPDYQVAQMAPGERAAAMAAQQGIGGYAPFLGAGSQMIGQGQNLLAGQAAPALQQAMGTTGAGQQFINQASQLAAMQRGLPYESQAAANQMLQQGLGMGTALGQEGIGQLFGSIGSAQQAAGMGAGALQGLAGGVGGQVGGAQFGADLASARARASTAGAQQALMGAAGMGGATAQEGIAALAGTGARFDPSQISPFMGQFEDAAVQQALSDIGRQGQIAQQGVRAQAVGAGAFGGSRQAVAEQELQRNVLEQQGRTAAQMRSAGFESAAQRAQQAFEQQQGRQQQLGALTGQLGQAGAGSALQAASQAGQLGLSAEQLAQAGALQGGQLGLSGIGQAGQLQNLAAQLGLSSAQQQAMAGQNIGALGGQLGQLGLSAAQQQGQLGLQFGQLGQQDINQLLAMGQQQQQLGQGIGSLAGQFGTLGGQLGQLGIQQAGIGELQSRLGAQDIQNLMATGGLERGVQQATLDAQRMSNLQRYSQPYQQYGFLSDIYSGVPTGQMTTTSSSAPQVSPFQTALGLGIQGVSAVAGANRAGII